MFNLTNQETNLTSASSAQQEDTVVKRGLPGSKDPYSGLWCDTCKLGMPATHNFLGLQVHQTSYKSYEKPRDPWV